MIKRLYSSNSNYHLNNYYSVVQEKQKQMRVVIYSYIVFKVDMCIYNDITKTVFCNCEKMKDTVQFKILLIKDGKYLASMSLYLLNIATEDIYVFNG